VDYVDGNGLLSALSDSTAKALNDRVVLPSDIEALHADGLRWVVVDSAVLPKGSERRWLFRDHAILKAVWGAPDVETGRAAAWRVEPIAGPVALPSLSTPPKPPDSGPFRIRRGVQVEAGRLPPGAYATEEK
jgi:hypothetical protein